MVNIELIVCALAFIMLIVNIFILGSDRSDFLGFDDIILLRYLINALIFAFIMADIIARLLVHVRP